jgi:hypothetical protein
MPVLAQCDAMPQTPRAPQFDPSKAEQNDPLLVESLVAQHASLLDLLRRQNEEFVKSMDKMGLALGSLVNARGSVPLYTVGTVLAVPKMLQVDKAAGVSALPVEAVIVPLVEDACCVDASAKASPEPVATNAKHHGIHAIDDEDQEELDKRHSELLLQAEQRAAQVMKEDQDDDPEDEVPGTSRLNRFVMSENFEVVMGIVILMNTLLLIISLDLHGLQKGHSLGLHGESDWSSYEDTFRNLEYVFILVYIMELVLRISAHGKSFFNSLGNAFDLFIVSCSCVDLFLFDAMDVGVVNISVLRVFRIARMLRLLKFMKHSKHVAEFRVIVRTLVVALRGVAWSMGVLGVIIGTGGVLMTQLVGSYLLDESITLERRKWMYNSFGTISRSAHSMFICTFTGAWHTFSRPLIEEVGGNGIFLVFWVIWVNVVNFMTMRVIGALFLKQTMSIAALDEEKTAMRNMKKKEMYASLLNDIFLSADETGDGAIGHAEFEKMMADPVVVENFAKLDLDVDEVTALYSVLSSDDGNADYNEFLHGALKMNSSARTIDSVQVMHKQMKMTRGISEILEEMKCLTQLIHHRR